MGGGEILAKVPRVTVDFDFEVSFLSFYVHFFVHFFYFIFAGIV